MEMSPFVFGLYKLVKFLIYPYTWLTLILGAIAVLAFLPLSPHRLRWIRVSALGACLVVFIVGNPLVASTMVGLIEERARALEFSTPGHFDAIVVLGGGVKAQGTLRPTTELTQSGMQRTICGANLFAQGMSPRLVLTGGDASIFGSGPKESLIMKRLARRLGVPDGAIAVESSSRTTYENAVETERLLGKASVLVVTSASHIPRALALFRKQGLNAEGYPCGFKAKDRPGDAGEMTPFDFIPTLGALQVSTQAINELVGIVAYWTAGKL